MERIRVSIFSQWQRPEHHLFDSDPEAYVFIRQAREGQFKVVVTHESDEQPTAAGEMGLDDRRK
jgi:hypothetical protein